MVFGGGAAINATAHANADTNTSTHTPTINSNADSKKLASRKSKHSTKSNASKKANTVNNSHLMSKGNTNNNNKIVNDRASAQTGQQSSQPNNTYSEVNTTGYQAKFNGNNNINAVQTSNVDSADSVGQTANQSITNRALNESGTTNNQSVSNFSENVNSGSVDNSVLASNESQSNQAINTSNGTNDTSIAPNDNTTNQVGHKLNHLLASSSGNNIKTTSKVGIQVRDALNIGHLLRDADTINVPGIGNVIKPGHIKFPVGVPFSISKYIPKGYTFINGKYTSNETSVLPPYRNNSWININGVYTKGTDKAYSPGFPGVSVNIPTLTAIIDRSIAQTPTDEEHIQLFAFPISLVKGNVVVNLVRHYLDKSTDTITSNSKTDSHVVRLPPEDSAVTDISTNKAYYDIPSLSINSGKKLPVGDGYYNDSYKYNLPQNWQSLDQSDINYQQYLKNFKPADNNPTSLQGTFDYNDNSPYKVGDRAQAELSNGILTLNYYQQPVNLTVKYYNKNTHNLLHTSKEIDNQKHASKKLIDNIPGVPSDLPGYRYNSNVTNSGVKADYDKNSNNISYTMNNNSNQTISVYLTPKTSKATIIYKNDGPNGNGNTEGIYTPSGNDSRDSEAGNTSINFKDGENSSNGANGLNPGFRIDNNQVIPYDNGKHVVWVHELGSINVVYEDTDENEKIVKTIPTSTNDTGTAFNIGPYMNDVNGLSNYSLDNSYNNNWNAKLSNYDSAYPVNTTHTEIIYVKHNTINVDPNSNPQKPGTPINPNNPNGPKWPDGTDNKSLSQTAVRTINYLDKYNHKKVSPSITQRVTFTRNRVIDTVTGRILKDSGLVANHGDTWSFVLSPDLSNEGYAAPNIICVRPKYGVFGSDNGKVVNVYYGHQTQSVGPHDPQKPGTPINPNDPNGPKWPNGTDKRSLQKTIIRTINYLDANDHSKEVSSSVTQPVTLDGVITVDKVTGNIIGNPEWTNGQWADKKSPIVNGYTIDPNSPSDVGAQHVNQDSKNSVVNVYYDYNNGGNGGGNTPNTPNIPNKPNNDPNKPTSPNNHGDNQPGPNNHNQPNNKPNTPNNHGDNQPGPNNHNQPNNKPSTPNNHGGTNAPNVPKPGNGNNNTPNNPSHRSHKPGDQPFNPNNKGKNSNNNTPNDNGYRTASINSQPVTHTLVVNYRDENGNSIPGVPAKVEQVTYYETGVKNNKTGETTWNNDWANHQKGSWLPVISPNLNGLGYGYPDRAIIDDQTPSYNGTDAVETVIYPLIHKPIMPSVPPTPNIPNNSNKRAKPNQPQTPNTNQGNNRNHVAQPIIDHPNNGYQNVGHRTKHRDMNNDVKRISKRIYQHRHSIYKLNRKLKGELYGNYHHKNNGNVSMRYSQNTDHVKIAKGDNNNARYYRINNGGRKLPQTNEAMTHESTLASILLGASTFLAMLGHAANRRKHRNE